jgi:gliding motility-associated-like protein
MELTPEAQDVCNISPVFNDFPPIVICANEPLVFDHSASDADGDQVVYQFCTPIIGGGLAGLDGNQAAANSCVGVTPNPACPPPFADVNFILPTYTELNPMAGNPLISINPVTGLISGTPTIQGQFVVGVCVEEYRNGELLSLTRRDFQFNVANCTPTVDALIDYDELVGQDQYVINACGETDVTFTNLSVQQQYISEYSWSFDIAGNIETYSEWEPTVSFPGIGTYQGQLVLNPGTLCGDTADIFVNLFPAVEADFTFDYDTCVAGPVDFTDLSFSDAGPGTITNWDWAFASQGTSAQQNPSFQFMDPGNLPVSLTVVDVNNCEDTETQIIEWFPAPAIIVIEPSTFDGCNPQEVFFNNLSFPIDDTYDIVWDFGDGTFGTAISPTHIYEEPGIYNISLEITSPLGCFISESWDDWIIVRPSPIADFTFTPLELNSFDPTAFFTDHSIDAISLNWDFDGDGSSFELNPSFTFPDTGVQEITLVVTHESGCTDTLIQYIDIVPKVTYFLPNAFTPNSDNVNDFFRGKGFFDGIENFRLSIWNRWGELVFETNDPTEGWNGRKKNTGELSPNGVYVCIATYSGPRGDDFEIKGFATLIK